MHRIMVALAIGLVTCGPAAAQATTAPLNAAVDDCLNAKKNGQTPEQAMATCEASVAKLDAAFTALGSEATPHLQNVYRLNRGFLFSQVGGAQGEIDKVRTSRVCANIEKAWAEVAKIEASVSPASFQESYYVVKKSALGATTKCRAEKGTPPGAPPLP